MRNQAGFTLKKTQNAAAWDLFWDITPPCIPTSPCHSPSPMMINPSALQPCQTSVSCSTSRVLGHLTHDNSITEPASPQLVRKRLSYAGTPNSLLSSWTPAPLNTAEQLQWPLGCPISRYPVWLSLIPQCSPPARYHTLRPTAAHTSIERQPLLTKQVYNNSSILRVRTISSRKYNLHNKYQYHNS